MSKIVDLSNRPIGEEIPQDSTPLAVLERLAAEITDGTKKPIRIIITIENDDGFFTRCSRMTSAEAIAMTAVAARMQVEEFLEL